jgi:hypothetical protein
MQPLVNAPRSQKSTWVYASLSVRDGQRLLKPLQISSDWLLFSEPPLLTSDEIEIILVNGSDEQRGMAAVLPHDPDALEIPIRLLPSNDDARL